MQVFLPRGIDTNYQLQNKASKYDNQTRRINLMQCGCMRGGNNQDGENKVRWKEGNLEIQEWNTVTLTNGN